MSSEPCASAVGGIAVLVVIGMVVPVAGADVYTPTPAQRLTEEDAQDFGTSVAVEDKLAAVASRDLVSIYTQEDVTWVHTRSLVVDATPNGLDIDQRRIVAGGNEIVSVIEETSLGWSVADTIQSPSGDTIRFGVSAALDGARLVVGAAGDSTANTRTGAVYVYERDPSTGAWEKQAQLLPGDAPARAAFGRDVALHGDTVIVGAPGAHAAYIFEETGSGWVQTAKFEAPDPTVNDPYAHAVDTNGNVAVIGAWKSTVDGVDDAGIVYVTARKSGGWSAVEPLQDPLPEADDFYGYRLALTDNQLVVGAPGDQLRDGVRPNTGAAFVYTGAGSTWAFQEYLRPGDFGFVAGMGRSLAADGQTVVAGAPNQGNIYIFDGVVGLTPAGSL